LKRESLLKQLLEMLILRGAEKSQSGKNQELNFQRNSKKIFEWSISNYQMPQT
jgi:hypothetical protein